MIFNFLQYLNEHYEDDEKAPTTFYHGSGARFSRFDISKVGSGEGVNKFGFGLYFSTSMSTARYYAESTTYGDKRATGLNMYSVELRRADHFLWWDIQVEEHMFNNIIDGMRYNGFTDNQIETMEENGGPNSGYGDLFTIADIYGQLEQYKSPREASQFLYDIGIPGVRVKDGIHEGVIYVAFSDKVPSILDCSAA